MAVLSPNTPAPDFVFPRAIAPQISLQSLRGKPAVPVLYPADWSPVCGDQLALYNEVLPEFENLGAQLIGISVDGIFCHQAYAQQRKLRFPLLADFEPKGAVARAYGAYRASDGYSERAIFIIDPQGIIRWSYLSPVDVNPGADGILAALEKLSDEATAHGHLENADHAK